MTFTVDDALIISVSAFRDKTDKSGKFPMVFHSIAVASEFDDPIDQMVALLHDVLEDTNLTVESLIYFGVPDEVIYHVVELTRLPTEIYFAYINRIDTLRSVRIKLEDIRLNYARLFTLDDQTEVASMSVRYDKAIKILKYKEKILRIAESWIFYDHTKGRY